MEWERELSVDDRESRFVESARLIAQLQAGLLEDLDWFDSAQVHTGDGCRSLSEWVTQKLDVSAETARSLVRTMRRTENKPHLREALATGVVSFDRVEALSKIQDESDLMHHLDVASVHRVAADRVEVTSDDEADAARERYLFMQPSLDQSWWDVRGGLDGLTGAVIDQALTEKADRLPPLPDGSRGSVGWRRATALYELASGGKSPETQITVFVNADKATLSSGRAGVRLDAGPRVGAQAIAHVLCNTTTEVTVNGEDGQPMRYGRNTRHIPSHLRRAILGRTGGHCAVFGCDSRYRVEVHHITPWSQNGTTDPENLIAICWYHHHVAIHERGFNIHSDDDGRVLLHRPGAKTRAAAMALTGGRSKG